MKDLIRKILKESEEDFELYFDDSSISEQFLYNKLMECELIESKRGPGWTKYVDRNGEILFLDNIDSGTVEPILYFDYNEIYLKLEELGLDYNEMKKLCVNMLYDTYKRKVLWAYNASL